MRNAKLNHTLSTFQSLREPIQEYNVDTIREEIKSYLASALHLFELQPSGLKTTAHPSTQSYKTQSNNAHSLSA